MFWKYDIPARFQLTLKKGIAFPSPKRSSYLLKCSKNYHDDDALLTFKFPCDPYAAPLYIHKSRLIAASGPLSALVSGPFLESKQSTVTIPHEKQRHFKAMFAYLYGVPFCFTQPSADLALTADRWGIPAIVDLFFQRLFSTSSNVDVLCNQVFPLLARLQVPKRYMVIVIWRVAWDFETFWKWFTQNCSHNGRGDTDTEENDCNSSSSDTERSRAENLDSQDSHSHNSNSSGASSQYTYEDDEFEQYALEWGNNIEHYISDLHGTDSKSATSMDASQEEARNDEESEDSVDISLNNSPPGSHDLPTMREVECGECDSQKLPKYLDIGIKNLLDHQDFYSMAYAIMEAKDDFDDKVQEMIPYMQRMGMPEDVQGEVIQCYSIPCDLSLSDLDELHYLHGEGDSIPVEELFLKQMVEASIRLKN